ncbi:glyoxalase family protein [Aspergillus fischeri NRRL 181]|uniref:Glyoxalase family protein n=1 Tax=Neosartorya fischeri (strain ATCC 1020 / DSM 3700 / CBS 544.65 / FGSC A1164 / JCM 1740 / NRRL 181 / WB 181) TaxID=331117 RepID=A1D5L4_NEOFI|nr:glyoxalase family protein [Aspergillus fischeri NRRL 181]EAW21008.1 glyoxalase family protein [Aspergillus fischeri NRRL 181]KAG2000987.1 hypothetical protein GB937_010627 [Aspergillus fischeri]
MASKNPTSGFRLTHVGLRVTDIDRSVTFYTSVFGMKELGRMGLDTTTVVFLGYPDAADPQTQLFAREGVLELKSQRGMAESNDYPDFRFVKLAIGVPDMATAMEHIRSHNVKILKEAGVAQGSEVVSTFLGCDMPDKGFDRPLWEAVVAVPFVEDPDGYLIEIIPY